MARISSFSAFALFFSTEETFGGTKPIASVRKALASLPPAAHVLGSINGRCCAHSPELAGRPSGTVDDVYDPNVSRTRGKIITAKSNMVTHARCTWKTGCTVGDSGRSFNSDHHHAAIMQA